MFRVVTDPPTGTLVRVRAGSGLELRFRRTRGPRSWRVAQLPDYLLPLTEHEDAASEREGVSRLRFLAFRGTGEPEQLRLELAEGDPAEPVEVRRLDVLVTR